MNITAFAGSSSSTSINKQLVEHTLTYFSEHTTRLLDLNDFEMPIFSVDREAMNGYPQQAHDFLAALGEADLIIISMAEHNGSYTAAFKNLFDWTSRLKEHLFQDKPVFLLSTSPGGYGGGNVMKAAQTRFPKHSAKLVETFSLPSFNDNFDPATGISEEHLRMEYLDKIASVKQQLNIPL